MGAGGPFFDSSSLISDVQNLVDDAVGQGQATVDNYLQSAEGVDQTADQGSLDGSDDYSNAFFDNWYGAVTANPIVAIALIAGVAYLAVTYGKRYI